MVYRYYSSDIKVLAVRWRLKGLSKKTIQRRLRQSISRQSFDRWMSLYHLTRAVIRNPDEYEQRGRRRMLNAADRKFIETMVEDHPSLFLDEIQRKLYNKTGKMPSRTTVHIELRACLLLTLKKAGVSNVRKNLVAKYSWMQQWLHVPAHYFVFTGESFCFHITSSILIIGPTVIWQSIVLTTGTARWEWNMGTWSTSKASALVQKHPNHPIRT